jgi:hypothetical protein
MPIFPREPLPAPTAQLFLSRVIEPVLCYLSEIPFSRAATQLLLGTAIKESPHFKYRGQLGGGPALGYFQMEPATHDDIWNNFLRYKPVLARQILTLLTTPDADKYAQLQYNDGYAAAMTRTHYLRARFPLANFDDIGSMAGYWKRFYNTDLGKGTVEEFITTWRSYTPTEGLYYIKNCTEDPLTSA